MLEKCPLPILNGCRGKGIKSDFRFVSLLKILDPAITRGEGEGGGVDTGQSFTEEKGFPLQNYFSN